MRLLGAWFSPTLDAGRGSHHLSGQDLAVPHHFSVQNIFLISIGNLPSFRLKQFPLVLSQLTLLQPLETTCLNAE